MLGGGGEVLHFAQQSLIIYKNQDLRVSLFLFISERVKCVARLLYTERRRQWYGECAAWTSYFFSLSERDHENISSLALMLMRFFYSLRLIKPCIYWEKFRQLSRTLAPNFVQEFRSLWLSASVPASDIVSNVDGVQIIHLVTMAFGPVASFCSCCFDFDFDEDELYICANDVGIDDIDGEQIYFYDWIQSSGTSRLKQHPAFVQK